MEFRRSLDESEMEIYGPGWKLEMELGWSRDLNVDEAGAVWMWLAHLQTLMCLIWRLDESLDIFKTWMEVRRSMDWYGMQIYVHLLTWDTICMERACEYWSLDWGETIIPRPGWEVDLGWFEIHFLGHAYGKVELEWSWDAILVTYMSVKCDLDEGETQKSVLVVCETWHVWRWDTNVVSQWKWNCTWMDVR